MGTKNITICDIAKKANVSIATVSRVINNTGSVSPRRRAQVLEIIDQCGYRPNSIARNLKMEVTKTIGVLVGDVYKRQEKFSTDAFWRHFYASNRTKAA